MTVTLPAGPRLTPDQVQATLFQPARLGRRGLDQEQVRAFCAQVENELVLLLEEKASLRQEVQRLRKRVSGGPDDDAQSAGLRPEDSHVQAVRILAKAQQTADRYVADAQEYSRELAEDARRRRDEIVAEARASAAMVVEQAHRDARRAAAAVPAPASAEALSTTERQGLEAELAYLRTFSDVCRTHLRAYLEALARNVEEWERAEKRSSASIRAELPRRLYNHNSRS
jgi:cell division septum initiation protein DivIVA